MADKQTVLLVDDEPYIQELFTRYLSLTYNCVVVSAKTVQEGLDYLKIHPTPQLVLLDINLPDHRGDLFLQTVRHDPKYASLPIYIFSSMYSEEKVAKLKKLGANGFFSKIEVFGTEQTRFNTTLSSILGNTGQ